MATDTMTHPRRTSLAWSAIFRAARLLAFGFLGWGSLSSADDPSLKAVSLIAVLGLATIVSVTWYLSRARAERRWQAAVARPSSRAASPRSSSGGGSGP
jgi:hypothetical protein